MEQFFLSFDLLINYVVPFPVSLTLILSTVALVISFRQIERYLWSRRSWLRHCIWICIHPEIHCTINLFLQFLLHLYLSVLLLCRIKYIHCFKIKSTDTSHKNFLQIFLHHMFISILNGLISFCFITCLSKLLDLLLVSSTNWLKLNLNSTVELFLVSLGFSFRKALAPSLEDLSHFVNSLFFCFVLKHQFAMFLELLKVFQS